MQFLFALYYERLNLFLLNGWFSLESMQNQVLVESLAYFQLSRDFRPTFQCQCKVSCWASAGCLKNAKANHFQRISTSGNQSSTVRFLLSPILHCFCLLPIFFERPLLRLCVQNRNQTCSDFSDRQIDRDTHALVRTIDLHYPYTSSRTKYCKWFYLFIRFECLIATHNNY
jgi:hypothetical protein